MKILLACFVVALTGGSALSQQLADEELDKVHAGFMDPSGEFAIGAVMKSYVDGTLELTSTLSMTNAGTVTSQQLGPGAAPLDATSLAGYNIASARGSGVIVPGDGGSTTFLHNFTRDQLTNMVVNSADNRSITQDTNITVTVPNLPAMQEAAALQGLGSRLQGAIGLQQLQSAGH